MYNLLIKIKGRIKKISNNTLKSEIIRNFNLQDVVLDFGNIVIEKNIIVLEILSKELLNKVIDEITKLKLDNRKLNILDLNLDIQEIKLEKVKRLLDKKSITLEFLTPTMFKVGSNFKEEYSNYIVFSWLLRKFNKELSKEEKINIPKDEIEKINIFDKKLERATVEINHFIVPAFKGKVSLSFEFVDNDFIEKFEKILNYGLKNNIGYKNKNGYGKIKIIN